MPKFIASSSQSHPRVAAEEEEEPIPIIDVKSDSEVSEEEENDAEYESDSEESVSDGQNRPASSSLQGSALPVTYETLNVFVGDLRLLNCPICHVRLSSPIFACKMDHVVCSLCCYRANGNCHSCPLFYQRSKVIEKIIQSVRIIDYEHTWPHTTRFTYNTTFAQPDVTLNQKPICLKEHHDDSVFFVLNHEVKEFGRTLNIDCVGPSSFKNCFLYQLSVKIMGTTFSLHYVPEVYAKWSKNLPRKIYLTIPREFAGYNSLLCVHVCIKKVGSGK